MGENKSYEELSNESDKKLLEISNRVKNQQHTLISEMSASIENAKNNIHIPNIRNRKSYMDIKEYNLKKYRYDLRNQNLETGTRINAWDIKENFISRELLKGTPGTYSSSILEEHTVKKLNDSLKDYNENEIAIEIKINHLKEEIDKKEILLAKERNIIEKAIANTDSQEFKKYREEYVADIESKIKKIEKELDPNSNDADNLISNIREYDKILNEEKNKIQKQESLIKNNIEELKRKKVYTKDPIALKQLDEKIKHEKDKINLIKKKYYKYQNFKKKKENVKIQLEKELKELKVKIKTKENITTNVKRELSNKKYNIMNTQNFKEEEKKIRDKFKKDTNDVINEVLSSAKFKKFNTKEELENALNEIENTQARDIVRNMYVFDKKNNAYVKQKYFLWNENNILGTKGITEVVNGDVSKIDSNFKMLDIDAMKDEYYNEKSKLIKEVQEIEATKKIINRFNKQNNNNNKEIVKSVRDVLLNDESVNEELQNRIISSIREDAPISPNEYMTSIRKILSNPQISKDISLSEIRNTVDDFDSMTNILKLLKSNDPKDILMGKNSIREAWTDTTFTGTRKLKALLIQNDLVCTSTNLLDNHTLPEVIKFVEQAVDDTQAEIINNVSNINFNISKSLKPLQDKAYSKNTFEEFEEDRSLNLEEDRILASEYDTGTAHKRDMNNPQYAKESKLDRDRVFHEDTNLFSNEMDSNIKTTLLQKKFMEDNKDSAVSKIRNRVVEITNANIKDGSESIRIQDLKRDLTLDDLNKGYININDKILPIQHTKQFNQLMDIKKIRDTDVPFTSEEWLTGKVKIGDNHFDIAQFKEYHDTNYRKIQVENAEQFINDKYKEVINNLKINNKHTEELFNSRLQDIIPKLTRKVKQTKRKRIYDKEKDKIVNKNYTIDREVPLLTDNYPTIAQSKISEKMFKEITPINPKKISLTNSNGENAVVEATVKNIDSILKKYNVKMPEEISNLLKEYNESKNDIASFNATTIEDKIKEINSVNDTNYEWKTVTKNSNDDIAYNKYKTNEKYAPILYKEKEINSNVLKTIETVQKSPHKVSLKFRNDTISYDVDKIEKDVLIAKPTSWVDPRNLTVEFKINDAKQLENMDEVYKFKEALNDTAESINKNINTNKIINGKTYDSKSLFNEFLNDRRYSKNDLNSFKIKLNGKEVSLGLKINNPISFNSLGFNIISTAFPWMISDEESIQTLAGTSELAVREAFEEVSSGEINKALIDKGISNISADKTQTAKAFEDAISEKTKVKILKQYMNDANKNNEFFLIDIAKKSIADSNQELSVENVQGFFNSIIPYIKQDKQLRKRFKNLESLANNKKSINELLQAYKSSDIKSFEKIFDSVEEGLENNLDIKHLKTLSEIHGTVNSNSVKDLSKVGELVTNVKINKNRENILKELGANDETFRNSIINSVAKKRTNQKFNKKNLGNLSKDEIRDLKNKEYLNIKKKIIASRTPMKDLYKEVSNDFLNGKEKEIEKILNVGGFTKETFNKLETPKQVQLLHHILETKTKDGVKKTSTLGAIKDIVNGKTEYMNPRHRDFYNKNKSNIEPLIGQYVREKGGINNIASFEEIQKYLKNSNVSDYEAFKDISLMSNILGIDVKFKGKDSQGNKVEFNGEDIKKGYEGTPGNIITNRLNNENLPIANSIEEITRKEKINTIKENDLYIQKKNHLMDYESSSPLFINNDEKITSVLTNFPGNYDKISELPGDSVGTFNPTSTLINTEDFRKEAIKKGTNAVTIDYETTGLKEQLGEELFSPVELSIQHVTAKGTEEGIKITPESTRSIFLAPNEKVMEKMNILLGNNDENISNLLKGVENNSTDIHLLKNYAKYDYLDAASPMKVQDGYVFLNKDNGWENSNMTPKEYVSKIQTSAEKVVNFLNNPNKAEQITADINPKNVFKNIASFMDAGKKEIRKGNPNGYAIMHNFSGAENPWTKHFTEQALDFIDNSGKKTYEKMRSNVEREVIKKPIDTMQLMKTVEPGRISFSLENLVKEKNINVDGTSHLASVDVSNTTALLENAINNPNYKKVSDAVNNPIKKGDIIFKRRHDSNSVSMEKGVYKISDIDNVKGNGVVLTLQQLSDHSDKKTIQVEIPNISTMQREANKNWSVVKNSELKKVLDIDNKMAYHDSIRTFNTAMKNYNILTLYKARANENGNEGIKQRVSNMKKHFDSAIKKTTPNLTINENGIKEFTTYRLTDEEKIALGNAQMLSDKGYSKNLLTLNKKIKNRRMNEMKTINNYMNTDEGKLLDSFLFEGHVRKEANLITDSQHHEYTNRIQSILHDFKKNDSLNLKFTIPNSYKLPTINSGTISTVAEATDKLKNIKPIEFNIDFTSKASIENSIWDVAEKIGKKMNDNNVVKSVDAGKSLALKKHVLPLLQKQGIIPSDGKWANIANKAFNLSSNPIPKINIESEYENMLPEVSHYMFNNKEKLIKENKMKPLEVVDMLKPASKEALPILKTRFQSALKEVDDAILTPNGLSEPNKEFESNVKKIINTTKESIKDSTEKMGGPIPFFKTNFQTEKLLKENSIKEFNITNPAHKDLAFKTADEIINIADSLPKDKEIMPVEKFISLYNDSETRDIAKKAMPEYLNALKMSNGENVDYITHMNKNIIENLNNVESQLKKDYRENTNAKITAYRELKNRASRKTIYDDNLKLLEDNDKTVFNARKVLGRIQENNNGEYFTAPIASPSDIEAIKNKTKLDPYKVKITAGIPIEGHSMGELTGYALTDYSIPQLKGIVNNTKAPNYDKNIIKQYLSIPNIEQVHTDNFAKNNLSISKAEKVKLQHGNNIESFSTIVENSRNSMDNSNDITKIFNEQIIEGGRRKEVSEKAIKEINPKNAIDNRIKSPLGKTEKEIQKGINDIIHKNATTTTIEKNIDKDAISESIGQINNTIKDATKGIKEITSTILNSSAVKYGMLGLAFAGTAFMLNRRASDGGRLDKRPQKDSAPNVNGEYDSKQYNGKEHPRIAPQKQVRVEENGTGMTINVNAKNRGSVQDKQVHDAIKDTINNSLTANINIHQRDDRQTINSNFVSDLISKALGK